MIKPESDSVVDLAQYKFDELYGSKLLKEKFSRNRNYTYFNTLLKLHNKYYEKNNIYQDLFCSGKPSQTL